MSAVVEEAGDGYADYLLSYRMNGQTKSDGNFNITSPGYYLYTVSLSSGGQVMDTYSAYYYREGSTADISQLQTLYKDQTKYTIGLASGQANYEYQIILHDAYGERVIKSYSADSSIEYVPAANGTYRFEYRSRLQGSTATFEAHAYVNVVHNFEDDLGIQLDIPAVVTAKSVNLINAKYLGENEDVLYKFIIHSRGMWKVERGFNPSGSIAFVPPKVGEYTLEIRVIHAGNSGYADTLVYSQKIYVVAASLLTDA